MGNALKTWFQDLNNYIYSRRTPNKNTLTTVDIDKTSLSTTPVQNESLNAPAPSCSEFYMACRSNDLEKVQQLMKTLTLAEIDRLEPNGSTALHVAAYNGHHEIVKLLLEAGADRSIMNKHELLPFDEAKTDEIKSLFLRTTNNNRLVSQEGYIEWERIDECALQDAVEERENVKHLYEKKFVVGENKVREMFERIEKKYIGESLKNANGIDKILRFFQKATQEEDPIWIITAYTAETDFYKFFNREMAVASTRFDMERKYLVALLLNHPKLDPYSFTGVSYRTMKITVSALKKYKKGEFLMTKSLVSSSIEGKIAIWFSKQAEDQLTNNSCNARFNANNQTIQEWVLCKYLIKHRRSALHIENKSQYAMEGEVLIMPFTVFKVKGVSRARESFIPSNFQISLVEFEECDEYSS